MIRVTLIAVALLLGYVLTVVAMMAATFGLTSASPDFVVRECRLTTSYKRLQAVIWLVCVTLGAFATYMVAQGTYPVIVGGLLALVFVAMLWRNSWEARQRGMAHQILMSMVSILGVVAGYELAKGVMGT
jgi:hypothetical protein